MATNEDYLLIEFEETFDLFAKDGSINSRDLRCIMKALEGSPPTDDQLKKMIQLVDCDGDGWITFPEFVKLLRNKFEEMDSADIVKEAFETYDTTTTGFVDKDVIRHVLTNHIDDISEDEINTLLDEFNDKEPIDYIKLIEDYDLDLSKYTRATTNMSDPS